MKVGKKRGQIWVETVIYTMIAFVLIAAVLAFVRPKIEKMQDEIIIKKSLVVMKDIDSTVSNIIASSPGNIRLLEIEIKKGSITFDGNDDKIAFKMYSRGEYSEPGLEIKDGDISILTEKKTGEYLVTLERKYDSSIYNLTYEGGDKIKEITPSSKAYRVFFSNKGRDADSEKLMLNIEVK